MNDLDLEDLYPNCLCGRRAGLCTSWTNANPEGVSGVAQISRFVLISYQKRKQCNRGVPKKKAESKSMSSTGEMEIIKGELMNVQENHFRNEVEDGNDSSIYTIFHVLLQCKLLCGHALGNQSSRGISGFAKNQATFVGKWDGSFFVLETNTLWFWKHLAHGCNVQNTGGALFVLVLFLLRSFILPKAQIPVWWSWGYLINQGNVTSLGVSSQSNAAAGEDINEVEDVGLL
ncbi:hypothetical protein LWI29_031935 [Acer saccharum]|uniref:Uncharacterized protein n=1 Tax=Acer saccharum TaxID=4024 RepID=A0AA39SS22_ACESA|nr:hypothetical protein LWI29_031935 [Acer saccharum]